ncbi:MAG: hypothetical protein AB1410_10840 [Acidobacteriota bacterium]
MIFLLEPITLFDLLNGFEIGPDSGTASSAAGVCAEWCETYCRSWQGCDVCYGWKSCAG